MNISHWYSLLCIKDSLLLLTFSARYFREDPRLLFQTDRKLCCTPVRFPFQGRNGKEKKLQELARTSFWRRRLKFCIIVDPKDWVVLISGLRGGLLNSYSGGFRPTTALLLLLLVVVGCPVGWKGQIVPSARSRVGICGAKALYSSKADSQAVNTQKHGSIIKSQLSACTCIWHWKLSISKIKFWQLFST